LEYEKLKETTGYKNIQRMSDSLVAAYNKVAANKIAFLYESLDKTFKELTYEMTRFASLDSEVHAEYKKMVNDFLLKAMKERMGLIISIWKQSETGLGMSQIRQRCRIWDRLSQVNM
jgi:hypothetical protein